MKIQPTLTPNMPCQNFGSRHTSAKLPKELRISPQHKFPKGLLIALFPIILLATGTIIWQNSDYYKVLKQFEQLMKDIKEAEIKQKDSANVKTNDTISMTDAIKLNEIG